MKNKSRVLGEIGVGVNSMVEGVEILEKGIGNGGVGETRKKRRKRIRGGGKENFDSQNVQKRLSNVESSRNIDKKPVKSRTERVDKVEKVRGNRESSRVTSLDVFVESSEKIDKRVIKSARTERVDKVEKVQGSRQSSRISDLEIVHVCASSEFSDNEMSPAAMTNVEVERKLVESRTERVEEVQGSRQSSRISNLEIMHVYASSECSDNEMSPAVMTNVVKEEQVERKLVESRTERVEEVQGTRRSSGTTNLESAHVYVSNECLDTDVSPAVMRNLESKEKRIVEDGRVKEKNPAKGKVDVHGWTKDQDEALQRAYFAAKPSPNFWKKVSKMVPGKTAQDCFDKIHSDLVTPPPVQPRSRAKKTISSPVSHFSLSGSKLLEPTLNVKWPKSNKQRKLRAQKTLRHLVQKRSMVDQGYEADLFSVLEPTQDFSQAEILSTPESKSNKKGRIQECLEDSSVQKKPLSRFRNSHETALVSPPVLKQVKNRALHEKYIDRLHCRDARRPTGPKKCNADKEERKGSSAKKLDDVTVARNALFFEANDMISKFKEAQANIVSDYEDSQDDGDCDAEDDVDC